MPFVQRDGAAIYYDTYEPQGNVRHNPDLLSNWIMLLNGHTRTTSDFKAMARYLVERGFSVLVMDHRGAGETQITRPFTLHDMVEDVAEVWKHVGITKSHLLGISMGGIISQYVVHQYPTMVDKLVIVSAPARENQIEFIEDQWGGSKEVIFTTMERYFSPEFCRRNRLLIESMVKGIVKAIEEGRFIKNSNLQRQAITGFDATPFLSSITAPTLVLYGDLDAIVKRSAIETFTTGIPNVTVKVFPGVGHLLIAEMAKTFYEEVASFMLR